MDTTMGRGRPTTGYCGLLAAGEFLSYDPQDDHSILGDQLVIVDKQVLHVPITGAH